MQNTFDEEQHLRAFLPAIGLAMLFAPFILLLNGMEQFWMIIIPAETTLLLLLLLVFFLELKTKIDETGVSYTYAPFVSTRHIAWHEVELALVTRYNPLKEFGGWGFRIGFGKKQALSVWGKYALRLKLKDGRELVLGTQSHEKLSVVINQYF